MKVLLLGGSGMLGHVLWRHLRTEHEVWVTVRNRATAYARFGLFEGSPVLSRIDGASEEALVGAFRASRPEVVVNCIGIVKQLEEAKDPLPSITINALLPHRLAELCAIAGARLIHISTDCVFTGRQGNYREDDISDAEDLYGRTKFLGEVTGPHCLTLRTSIIGRELESRSGLIEWFLSQRGKTIRGFRRAIYTGLTTLEISRVIGRVISRHGDLSGLWHLSSDRISKFDLLRLAREAFDWEGEIVPEDGFVCDRSLDSGRFRAATNYCPPDWGSMLAEIAVAEPRAAARS